MSSIELIRFGWALMSLFAAHIFEHIEVARLYRLKLHRVNSVK